MSNYLAIATVTASLQKLLQDSLQYDIQGATVTTVRPDSSGSGMPVTGVNIFLYRVAPVNWNNSDLPGRRSIGEGIKSPYIALDLNYILTFYGKEAELEPQRLLGSVIRTLFSNPILKKETIESTISDRQYGYLSESNLAEQVQSVQLIPMGLSTEDLSKIWSVFFQTPYSLSVAYQGRTVLIDSKTIPSRALPVRRAAPKVVPVRPTISEVLTRDELNKTWRSAKDKPILANSNISIVGKGFVAELTIIKIGTQEITPQKTTDREISLDLGSVASNLLRAGVQGIQVLQRYSETSKRFRQSNLLPFILFPQIEKIEIANLETIDNEFYSLSISILVNPTVGKTQRVVILLNQIAIVDPAEYILDIPTRFEDSNQITTDIQKIRSGDYLVRISIDGVENLLHIDRDANSPTFEQYVGPKIVIS